MTKPSQANLYSFEGLPKATRFGQMKRQAWPRKFIDTFLSDLPIHAKIVEIGPGPGDFAKECCARGWDYTGIEALQKFYDELKSMRIPVIQSTVPPLPFPDESMDVIHADQVIEHFNTSRDFTEFLAEAHRVLKTGGVLSLAYPNFQTMVSVFYDSDYTHRLAFTKFSLERACLDYGFKIKKSVRYLNLFVGGGFAYHCLRHVLIGCVKLLNTAIIAEVTDSVASARRFRQRFTKTCLDNICIQAEKVAGLFLLFAFFE